ncbi:hypothetical protein RJD28_11415 [Oscillospiraceae bacterium NTUH-002-81]|nr:hypothetical protein RJD28_11415 [Oscillospiraceae bacterium NTUH-002-81]
MLEIMKYFAGKINLSISLLMGVVFPGTYVLVFRNFELFERLDVLKLMILALVITIPSYVICLILVYFFLSIWQIIRKCVNSEAAFANALLLAGIGNVGIVLNVWKENFTITESHFTTSLKMSVIFSIIVSFGRLLGEKRK